LPLAMFLYVSVIFRYFQNFYDCICKMFHISSKLLHFDMNSELLGNFCLILGFLWEDLGILRHGQWQH